MRGAVQLGLAVGYFLATCGVGLLLYRPLAERPVDVGEPEVAVEVARGQLQVTARVMIVPRARARLLGVRGGVTAGGVPLVAKVAVNPPDGELRAGRPELVSVTVEIPLATAGTLAAGSVLNGGRVSLAFDGSANVEVLGMPTSFPLHVSHRLEAATLLVQGVRDILPGLSR